MDFPVCPSCRQSVIDDDAVDCPFCGASMKAKPGAKPAAPAAKPSAPAAKPAPAKPTVTKPGGLKPTLPGDDLPFESELTTGKAAIQAIPSPTKQRTLKVICPMCDTPGYLPQTAAGQTVRCSNSKCVMPVFTAPSNKKEAPPPPPPPPPPSKLPMILGITAVAVLLFAVGVYFALFHNISSRPKELDEEAKQALAELAQSNKKKVNANVDVEATTVDGAKKENDKEGSFKSKAEVDQEELVKLVLKQMRDSSLTSERQRSKPFCRQMAAEANAIMGIPDAAREHLKQLMVVGQDVSYYRIIPLTELFWSEFSAGDKKGAVKTLNAAMNEVPKIPKFGRTRLEIAGRLAAALAAADRIPEALSLLQNFQSTEPESQLAARLQMANDGRVARLSDTASVLPWKSPQTTAATASLIYRGEIQTALAWALAQPNDDAKVEALSVWAQELAQQQAPAGTTDVDGKIAAAVESLAPAFAARVWARAGCGRLLARDLVGVTAAIELATQKLATVAVPVEPTIPPVKTTNRYKLPSSESLYRAATAAAEIAFLQAQRAETKADAEKSLDLALAYARGTAPTFASAQQRQDELDRNAAGVREVLKKELRLKDDDEIRRSLIDYKRILSDIVDASRQKFEFETQILVRLRGAGVGLNSKVWIIISTRSFADDINQQENFFNTSLPGELIEAFKGTADEKAVLGAWIRLFAEPAPPRPTTIVFDELLKTDVADAVEFIQSIDTKSGRREELLLRTASRLPTERKSALALQFISQLDDLVVREDCYRLAATMAAQRGEFELIKKQVTSVQQHTEKAALCRGLIGGLKASGKQVIDFQDLLSKP